ncbi:MAG: hypothetical protein M3O82_01185 [Verrucomicrobiota bacterium]|nr:hypothetical protein [Verrucomicrobiota bacterium]
MSTRRIFFFLSLLTLAACEPGLPEGIQAARIAMVQGIKSEAPGDYYIGRRYYKADYKFWGYVRRPGEPWSSAKLVMFNEQHKLAPDREIGKLGSDNNYEYKLLGSFSGETVYEPSSNGFYPEFVLTGYELRSISPAPIFKTPAANDPSRRVIGTPY